MHHEKVHNYAFDDEYTVYDSYFYTYYFLFVLFPKNAVSLKQKTNYLFNSISARIEHICQLWHGWW